MQRFDRHRASRVGRHPDRGGVDHAGSFCQRIRKIGRGQCGHVGVGLHCLHRAAQALNPICFGVEHEQPPCTEADQRVCHGRPCSSRTEKHDDPEVGVREGISEGPAKAGDVGVVTDRHSVVYQDGVEGAYRLYVGCDPVHERDHRLLDRMSDVEPVEAKLDGELEQLSKVVGADVLFVEVDDFVDVAKLLSSCLPLVQLWCQ